MCLPSLGVHAESSRRSTRAIAATRARGLMHEFTDPLTTAPSSLVFRSVPWGKRLQQQHIGMEYCSGQQQIS